MSDFWGINFLNANEQRAYPLTEAATAQDTTGTITIPTSFIVALSFPVHAGLTVDPSKFFLSALVLDPTGYTITISYDDGTASPPPAAIARIASSTHVEYLNYAMAGIGDFADCVGQIALGKLDEINQLPAGHFLFSTAGGQLEPDCIRPQIRWISSITVANGNETSPPLVGDIVLASGTNFRLDTLIQSGQPPQIIFNAIDGAGLSVDCVCGASEVGPCIRTIDGIGPLPDGDFRLLVGSCMTLTAIPNGLAFADTCSQPCCGCPQLDELRTQLDRFGDGLTTLQSFSNRLSGEVSQMAMVVLGSRLSDQGCSLS